MDVSELVAASVGTRPASNSQCWARRVEGDARTYLTAIEDVDVKDVYQVKVVEVLNALGYDVSPGQVSDHLHEKCLCRR